MAHLGDRVKALRKHNRLTQDELGAQLNMGKSSVSLIETRGATSEETIDALVKIFGCDRQWIVSGKGTQPDGIVLESIETSTPWKDEAYEVLKRENQRLWLLVEKLSGAPAGSFLKPLSVNMALLYSSKKQTVRELGGNMLKVA